MTERIVLLLFFFVLSQAFTADEEDSHHIEPYVGTEEFERLKKLVGTWEGTTDNGDQKGPTKVEYFVSSRGSALIEKIFIGTPHEMVSVYHERGGKLVMTHYCALANQPNMLLTKKTENTLSFEFGGYNDIDPTKDWHIHALDIAFESDDAIIQNWTSHKDGKEDHAIKLTLTRVK